MSQSAFKDRKRGHGKEKPMKPMIGEMKKEYGNMKPMKPQSKDYSKMKKGY